MWNPFEKPKQDTASEEKKERKELYTDPNSGMTVTEEELREMRENADRNNP